MKARIIFVLTALSSMFVACGDDDRGNGSSQPSACEKVCECEGCSDQDLADCEAELADVEDGADQAGCSAEFDDYVDCVADEGECVGGDYQVAGCSQEMSDFVGCAQPVGCSSANDGVCDEPEGTGFCDEGTDINDCNASGG